MLNYFMHISEKDAKRLFPDLSDHAKPENFRLTSQRNVRRYEESDIQKAFVATFRESKEKGLFRAIPDLVHIELSAVPQFYLPMSTPAQRKQAMIRGVRN